MEKHREKLRKRLFSRGPFKTLSGVQPAKNRDVSQSANASSNNLTERHVLPTLPAQVASTTSTAQATLTSSLAHAAPPVANPPAEPNPKAEERQSVTKRQNPAQPSDEETPQDSSELLRPSCWAEAAKRLQVGRPDVYRKLEKIKSEHNNQSQSDPAGLLELAVAKRKENKGIPSPIETTIRSILQFKEIVGAAANFDPHRIAPTVWRGFCVVLEACLGESTLLREALRDLDAITSNLSYWANVESLFLGTMRNSIVNKFEPLESELIKLYTEILELEVELVSWASNGGIAQVFKTQGRAVTWRDLVKKIYNYHGDCKTIFDRCKMKSDQHGKVKKWISEYRPEQAHDDALQRTGVAFKYRACGRWLLDSPKFTDWSSSEPASDSRVLWLRGTTGTGKSTLLARIIQWHLDNASLYPGRRFAYFYCSRRADLNPKHSYKSVLQAILRQAAYDPVKGEISTHVLDAYIDAGGDSEDLEPFSFTKCETLLHGILKSRIKLRIMIDALDECDEPKELLKALRNASQVMPGGLELLVSSRHEVWVDEKLPHAVRVDLSSSISDTDMVTYITTEVNDREDDERILKGKHPDLEDRLIEILCGRAGGMFRWVQLQLSFFLKPKTPFCHAETIKTHLNRLDTGSTAVEEDLIIAYNDIFKRNTDENDKDSLEHRHVSKIYRMLLCGKRPLSMAAVMTAVAFNEDKSLEDGSINDAYIRQLTQDFIVETNSGVLEFAHVSVKDYLQGKPDYSDAKCHAQVARTCLKYISSRATYEVTKDSNAFLQYSHTFWGEHCAQLTREERQSLGVSKELLDWIIEGSGSTKFKDWLHAADKFSKFSKRSWTSDSGSPVFSACDWNLIEVLDNLLVADPTYNLNLKPDNNGYTPLSLAAYRGHKTVVELLLRTEKIEINAKGSNNQTALFCATSKGHEAVVKLLLEEGADIAAADIDGATPLHEASRLGHVEVVKLLLKEGADIAAVDIDRATPLHEASEYGEVEVVKLLLEEGVNIAAVDSFRATPLHVASRLGQVEVVKLLLEEGADIAAVDISGATPLHEASIYRKVEVVKLLLEEGADIVVANIDRTILLYQASIYGRVEVVKLLLEEGADIAAVDIFGATLLHKASEYGQVEVVKLLLEEGADIAAADINGATLLHQASKYGQVEVVKLLLEEGADIAAANRDGATPLHQASRLGHVEIVKLLLKEGADIAAADIDGATPLYQASKYGQVEVVKLLLEGGADIAAADIDGATPLYQASKYGRVEVVKLLSGNSK